MLERRRRRRRRMLKGVLLVAVGLNRTWPMRAGVN